MPHLVDVGLYGDSKVPVVEGQAYFTSMRFLSTTSMNEGTNETYFRKQDIFVAGVVHKNR